MEIPKLFVKFFFYNCLALKVLWNQVTLLGFHLSSPKYFKIFRLAMRSCRVLARHAGLAPAAGA